MISFLSGQLGLLSWVGLVHHYLIILVFFHWLYTQGHPVSLEVIPGYLMILACLMRSNHVPSYLHRLLPIPSTFHQLILGVVFSVLNFHSLGFLWLSRGVLLCRYDVMIAFSLLIKRCGSVSSWSRVFPAFLLQLALVTKIHNSSSRFIPSILTSCTWN